MTCCKLFLNFTSFAEAIEADVISLNCNTETSHQLVSVKTVYLRIWC